MKIEEIKKEIMKRMVDLGMRRGDLAEALGVTRGRVTRFLGGDNMKVKTLERYLDVVGLELTVKEKEG